MPDPPRLLAERVELADSWWRRLWGLQFRSRLSPWGGLMLVPCASIHTFWMRFSIDVVCLDATGVVTEVCRSLRPWRVFLPRTRPYAILELDAETARVHVGDRVFCDEQTRHCHPTKLRFLCCLQDDRP